MNDSQNIKLKVFVSSQSITTESADLETLKHECARPLDTGALDRMGKGDFHLPEKHRILLDAVIRATKKMGWEFEIIDTSEYSFWKKLRMKEIVPRVEYEEHVLEGTPMSQEIIEFVERCRGIPIVPKISEQEISQSQEIRIQKHPTSEEQKASQT